MSVPGNQNAAKGHRWRDAINRALEKRAGLSLRSAQVELDILAEKFLVAVENGDIAAFRELADRLDGKAAQAVTLAGDGDNPLVHKIVREIVDPK
jgi:hypothetical protein